MEHITYEFYQKFVASSRIKDLSQMEHLYLMILAGGEGTRLFPYSNPERPKQLCHIDGGDRNKDTFLKRTITNFVDCGFARDHIIITTSSRHQANITRHQAANPGGVPIKNIWEIPAVHGYAGTMVEATKKLAGFDNAAIVLNTPSDHFLTPDYQFINAITEAINYAKQGYVCTVENVAQNTGILAWQAADLLKYTPEDTENLGYNQLMDAFQDHRQMAVGDFKWQDCDTFRGLYRVLDKTSSPSQCYLG